MTNREKIISNDFYDVVADYVLLEELRASAPPPMSTSRWTEKLELPILSGINFRL